MLDEYTFCLQLALDSLDRQTIAHDLLFASRVPLAQRVSDGVKEMWKCDDKAPTGEAMVMDATGYFDLVRGAARPSRLARRHAPTTHLHPPQEMGKDRWWDEVKRELIFIPDVKVTALFKSLGHGLEDFDVLVKAQVR